MIFSKASLARRHWVLAVRLNLGIHSDLAWWTEFVGTWNGTGISNHRRPGTNSRVRIRRLWLMGVWCMARPSVAPNTLRLKGTALDISCKELIPSWPAPHGGISGQGTRWSVTATIVAALCSSSSRQLHLMHLLRCMAFAEASLNLNISATLVYISTKSNH